MQENSKQKFWGTKPVRTESVDIRRNIVLSMIPLTGRILDVACGDGMTLSLVNAKEKYGIDINASNVESAKKRGIIAVCEDVENGLPYKDDYFDVVITEGLLQHLYSPENLMEELRRVLKPGGLFIGSIPNNYHIWHRVAYLLGRPQSSFLFRDRAAQVSSSFFNLSKFRKLLASGFEIEICTGRPGRFSSLAPSLFGWDIVWKARKKDV